MYYTSRSSTPLRKNQLQPPHRHRKLIPQLHLRLLPLLVREHQVKPTQQRRRDGPDLHEGEVLAHAAEAALEEGRKGRSVAHELRFRVPALGDELEGPREARGEAVEGVDGQADGGGAGDEGRGDGEAFGRGLAEAAGRDGRVQAEGLVDGAVEVGQGVQGAGVRVGG